MLLITIAIVLTPVLFAMCAKIKNTRENNQTTKDVNVEANWPFIGNDQFLVRDVCLLPKYERNQIPRDGRDVVQVNLIYLRI